MRILVTNDDGIFAEGLWLLVKELMKVGEVAVVAPDREQSAIGTAITLHQPIRARGVRPLLPITEAYAVEGTPSDSVILALGKLLRSKVDLLVSGINEGANVGSDVLISGTVSAALQGNRYGLPAIAVSVDALRGAHLGNAARLAALLAGKISSGYFPGGVFLNVNVPDLPLAKLGGVRLTRLAEGSHAESVKEGNDGKRGYFWLVRERLSRNTDGTTDMGALAQGYISITSLDSDLTSKTPLANPDGLCDELFRGLQHGEQ